MLNNFAVSIQFHERRLQRSGLMTNMILKRRLHRLRYIVKIRASSVRFVQNDIVRIKVGRGTDGGSIGWITAYAT